MSQFSFRFGRGASLTGGVLLAALSATAACGKDVDTEDCKSSRTCPVDDSGGSGGSNGSGGSAGEAAEEDDGPSLGGQGGAPDAAFGGALPSNGGEGGEPPVSRPECDQDAACSNDDATDGAETCVAGKCAPGDAPPHVVSVTPASAAADVEPNAPIVIEFSEPLDAATVTPESVRLLDGETPLAGELSYEGKVATFLPALPLTLNASFRVSVSEAVTDAAGVALVEPFSSDFAVRDGSWHVVDLTGTISGLAPTSPLTATGALMLSWMAKGTTHCPVTGAWLELGASKPMSRPFAQSAESCELPRIAANSAGVGAAMWMADGLHYLEQFRADGWETKPLQATPTQQFSLAAISVSPRGVVSRFETAVRQGGLSALRTNTSGAWQSARDVVLPDTIYLESAPRIAFDDEGNGVMTLKAWHNTEKHYQIMTSRYAMATGSWETARVIAGSESTSTPSYDERGTPAIEVAPTGDAMVVWPEGPAPGRLMSSYFRPDSGWSAPALVSSTVDVPAIDGAPSGLTFDGERFVAAWLGAPDDGVRRVYTASFDATEGWTSPQGHDAKRALPLLEHPQIVSDRHGSSLLVWRTGAPGNYPMVQRRFIAGSWAAIEPLPGNPRTGQAQSPAPVAMNASGVAAITWPVEDEQSTFTAIHVARFY